MYDLRQFRPALYALLIVGISSFQIMVMLLVSASHFTPMTLTVVKNAMNSRPHRMPAVVRVLLAAYTWKFGPNLA